MESIILLRVVKITEQKETFGNYSAGPVKLSKEGNVCISNCENGNLRDNGKIPRQAYALLKRLRP